jgi:nucleotide-binding universal stress UspA family protein
MPGLVSEVASQLGEDMDRETARAVKEAEAYLHKIGHSHLFGRGWRAIVAVGSPCSEILEAARSNGADIIAVSTHGRHGLDKVLYGSVALDLLRHVEMPLLIVHGRVAAMEPINLISAQTLEQRRRTFFMQSDT